MKALLLLPFCLLAASPAAAASVVIAAPGTSTFIASRATVASIFLPAAAPTTIDFEGYSDPTWLYSLSTSGATFTGDGATTEFGITTFNTPNWGTSGPKILCPYTPATNGYCSGDFTVTFANPVTGLQFYFTGDRSTAALTVQAFLNGSSLGSKSVNGDGNAFTAQLVNLSNFGQITSIKVTGGSGDVNGFGYDDFSFTALPEPSTWAMMLIGFGGIGIALRGRRSGHSQAAD